jgi:hypothetical protein
MFQLGLPFEKGNVITLDGGASARFTDQNTKTKSGASLEKEWEKLDPSEPWSNIGYWGEHPIIYLPRLFEGSRACNAGRLNALNQPRIPRRG